MVVGDLTSPEPAASPPLHVRLFGRFEVEGHPDGAFGSRKARLFLKVLALARGRSVSTDVIADILWADRLPAKPNDQLSVLASRLRKVLGSDRIERTDGGYRLVAERFDLDEAEQLAAEAGRRLTAESSASAGAAALAALRLVRGPLLEDEPDATWAEADRAAAARLVSRLRMLAAGAELAAGNPTTAATLAEQALDHDPYDESALRLLMDAHVAAGRPASALAAYARVRGRLRDELGVSPSATTERRHTQLLQSLPDAPPSSDPVHASDRRDRDARDRPVELPGRSEAMAELDRQLDAVARGEDRLVLVEGESGIGKSTLLDAWLTRLRPESVPLLLGTCDEVGRHDEASLSSELPLQAIIDALHGHLDQLEPDVVDELLGPETEVLAPLLGLGPGLGLGRGVDPGSGRDVRTGGGASAGPNDAHTGETGRALLFTALLTVLARIARPSGAVLVLDDLHFAGESTREWIRFFRRRARQHGLLVIVASRPQSTQAALPVDAHTVIELGPLDLAAAVLVVGHERASQLFERSGGHPLLLAEMAAMLQQDEHGDHQDPGVGVPESIRAAVGARLRQVGPVARTLETAAVLGRIVDLDLLAATLERPALHVLDELERGVEERFLDESRASFVFRHDLVREAIAGDVSAPRRALLHRTAAQVLAERNDTDPLVVARHAQLGGDLDLATDALAGAARLAISRYAHAEAVRLLDEAIELRDSFELRLIRGRARMVLGDHGLSRFDAETAVQMGGGARALELAGWAAYYQRDFASALPLAEEGARIADDPDVRASCLLVAGRVLLGSGDLPAADERIASAIAISGDGGPSVGSIWLAGLRNHQSRPIETLALASPAQIVAQRLDPFAVAHLYMARVHALGQLGRADEALRACDELEHHATRMDLPRYRGPANNWRGWILRYLGRLDEARDAHELALELASNPPPYKEPKAHALLDLADLALMQGDLDETARLLEVASPLHADLHTNRWRHALRSRLLRARLLLAAGEDVGYAETEATAVVDEANRLGVARYHVLASIVMHLSRRVSSTGARGRDRSDEELANLLPRLPAIAGTEAWWWTAQAATLTGSDAFGALAEQRVRELQDRSGEEGHALLGFAEGVIGRRIAKGPIRKSPRTSSAAQKG